MIKVKYVQKLYITVISFKLKSIFILKYQFVSKIVCNKNYKLLFNFGYAVISATPGGV